MGCRVAAIIVGCALAVACGGDSDSAGFEGSGGASGGGAAGSGGLDCGSATTCVDVCRCNGATEAECVGVCGMGSGGSSGTGAGAGGGGVGGTGAAGAGGTGPTGFVPARCHGDASKTIMIGDSYLALSGDVTRFLEQYSGQKFRTHYVSGTQMVGGLPPSIPDQARAAYQQGPVESVIMTGGGNDILIGDATCRVAPMGATCLATVQRTLDAAGALMVEAASKGVREVVYFFYPHLPGSLLAPIELNQVLDHAAPLAKAICENSTVLDCTFIDTRPAFMGHPEYIGVDGIHPTAPGSEAIAKLLWAAMQNNCATGLAAH